MSKNKSNMVVVDEIGIACPRCRHKTQVRIHGKITVHQLSKPYYYSKWFYCMNPDCKTTMIMLECHRVYKDHRSVPPEPEPEQERVYNIVSSDEVPW